MGDQLNRGIGALAEARSQADRILLIESESMLAAPFHRQRLHLVVAAMRRFAAELDRAGYRVDYRRASTLWDGFRDYLGRFDPEVVVATEPNGREAAGMLTELGVAMVESNQFLCHRDRFAEWAAGRSRLRMEDLHRWQ